MQQQSLLSYFTTKTMPPQRKRKPEETTSDEHIAKKLKTTKEANGSGPKPGKGKPAKGKPARPQIPDVSLLDFKSDAKTESGEPWNWKMSSWNVNGIRAWLEKNGLSYIHHELPDVIGFQETKCSDGKLPDEVVKVKGYHSYWCAGVKEGYSGVGLLSKTKPLKVSYGIGVDEHDKEGRVITAEYEKFYFITTYVPNSGKGLVRLNYRQNQWDVEFRKYMKKLEETKPVILCGDLNVSHQEIDIANPKSNKRSAGFTQEERDGFTTLLDEGYIDTFRHLNPDKKAAYTYWTYMMNARSKNVGWRLDYFVISKSILSNLCDSVIRSDVHGSDHCPVTLLMAF